MTKLRSASVLAVAATVVLASTCSVALSLLPRRARVLSTSLDGHTPSPLLPGIHRQGLFAKKRRSRSSSSTLLRWVPSYHDTSASSPFLFQLSSTKEKEDVTAAYFDETDDEKSWPIKPSPPPPPPSMSDRLAPLLDPTIAKNVPSDTIQGAAISGAFLTLLTSFYLFGPFSVAGLGTLVAAASPGIIAAFLSITEGFAGDLARGVGRITKDTTDGILAVVGDWQ